MATHSYHRITDAEDAAFDATMKVMGIGTALLVIVGIALWFIYS